MTRKSRPTRSCGLCKPHKRQGNSKKAVKASVRRKTQDDPDELRDEGA